MAKTYQFFYVMGRIKWKLDDETTDLGNEMLNDRQKMEVEALWHRVEQNPKSVMIYDKVRDWATGSEIEGATSGLSP